MSSEVYAVQYDIWQNIGTVKLTEIDHVPVALMVQNKVINRYKSFLLSIAHSTTVMIRRKQPIAIMEPKFWLEQPISMAFSIFKNQELNNMYIIYSLNLVL